MPEGPEVLHFFNEIEGVFNGSILLEVFIVSGRYTKRLPEGYNLFEKSEVVSFFC